MGILDGHVTPPLDHRDRLFLVLNNPRVLRAGAHLPVLPVLPLEVGGREAAVRKNLFLAAEIVVNERGGQVR